jgi:hypothetical protein
MVTDSAISGASPKRACSTSAKPRYAAIFDRMLADHDTASDAPLDASPSDANHDTEDDDGPPILIIEDDLPGSRAPAPTVKREDYRHLFSRLRSG